MKQDPSRGGGSTLSPAYSAALERLAKKRLIGDAPSNNGRAVGDAPLDELPQIGNAPPGKRSVIGGTGKGGLGIVGDAFNMAKGIVLSPVATVADIAWKPFEAIPGAPDFNPEDAGTVNLFVQGGKSLEHVGGDAYQLGRSIFTGKDTLSESPSAKAYQAAGGGLGGTLAATSPYLELAGTFAPIAVKGLGPRSVGMRMETANARAIAEAGAKEAAERASVLNETLNATRQATGKLDPNAYDAAINRYREYLTSRYVPSNRRVGQYVDNPSDALTRRLAAAQREIAVNSATGAAPTNMLVGVNPNKTLQIIGEGSSYGPMFDADKIAQIAVEREGYRSKFGTQTLDELMAREGVGSLDDYAKDRLIVESQLFGVPFDAPVSSRPIYAVDPQIMNLRNIAGYTGSPNQNRFSLGLTYDVSGRPITLTESDSFPTYVAGGRVYPPELGRVLNKPGNYQEMQVYGGQLPSSELRSIDLMFGSPDSVRYSDPNKFYSWVKANYPQDVQPLVTQDFYAATDAKGYIDNLVKVVNLAKERGIPVNAQQLGSEFIFDLNDLVASNSKLPNNARPFGGGSGSGPMQAKYLVEPTMTSSDYDQIIAGLEQSSNKYGEWLKWYEKNGKTYQEFGDRLAALRSKAISGRAASQRRIAERLASEKAVAGFSPEDIAKAREVTPYPANVLPELEDFLVAANAEKIDEAAAIWRSMNDKWKEIIESGKIPSNQRYWMTSINEGLGNLVDAGLIRLDTKSKLFDVLNKPQEEMPYKPGKGL